MTDLLCRRPKQYLLLIKEKWSSKYGKTLAYQIEHKLSGKTRGIPYRILNGLLQSEAEIDCRWIKEKMCKLITINSNDYIDILVNKFKK